MGYEQLMQGVVVVLTTPILWETHRHPVMFPQAPNGYPVGIPSESLLTTFTRMEPLQSNGKSQMPLMGIQYPPMGIPWESSGDPSGIPVRNNQGIPIRIPLEPHTENNPNGTPIPHGNPKSMSWEPHAAHVGAHENDKMNPSKVLSGSSQSIFTKIHVEPHTAWEYQTPAMGIPRGTPWGIQWGIQVLLRCSSSWTVVGEVDCKHVKFRSKSMTWVSPLSAAGLLWNRKNTALPGWSCGLRIPEGSSGLSGFLRTPKDS